MSAPADFEAMKALLAQVPDVIVARIEAGATAMAAIKAAATPAAKPTYGPPLSPIWGVPLVPLPVIGYDDPNGPQRITGVAPPDISDGTGPIDYDG